MDEKPDDPRAALREAAAEEDAGLHPGMKRLIAYREGRLLAAEREALQDHLALCPRCTGLLREMRAFEAASAGAEGEGPEALRQEAWDSLVRRLPRPTPVPAPAVPRRPVPSFFYGLAAALLLAVLG